MALNTVLVDEETALQPDSTRNKHGHNKILALPRAFWILVSVVTCGSAVLVHIRGAWRSAAPGTTVLAVSPELVHRGAWRSAAVDPPRVIAASPEMEVAQGAFYWGIDQKKFDLPEKQCVQFFEDYFAENVVVDYSGGPCEFLTGVHEGIPEVCGFFKNMDGRSQVTQAPETVWFQNGNIVLAKVHGPYITIPEGKKGVVDEIVAITMMDGKITRMELFASHAKNFVC